MMASLQRFSSHGQTYWRIVESYRRHDGRPTVRVLMHLGKAEQLLSRLQEQDRSVRVSSLSSGAVEALDRVAREFDVAGEIDHAISTSGARVRVRDGLTVGQTLTAAAIARACHPASKRAFAEWAATTTLPERMGFKAEALSSQHFWDQMDALPAEIIAVAEDVIVERVMKAESLPVGLVAYDTTNFFTHIASTNQRPNLPERGHNKQRRHDLRQLGLALVVSEEAQIPLGHYLYEGARPDVKTFASLIEPVRVRLQRLLKAQSQLTLVFDQGAESKANLEAARASGVQFVTALKPTHHRAWLRSVTDQLEPCTLPSGEVVRALKTTHRVHGQQQTVVVVWSQTLHEGQRRGLQQHLTRALKRLAKISRHPRQGIEGARAQVQRICARQYLRDVLRADVEQKGDEIWVTPLVDAAARERLERDYFGYRILATTHADWSAAQVIEAYRGQARVERAFRDLKDPWACAFRPQYHWTDQKLLAHGFIAVLSLLLARVLLHRARKSGFTGTQRTLLLRLAKLRTSTLIQIAAGSGRPRVTRQLEECDESLRELGRALGAIS
jgi:transposase